MSSQVDALVPATLGDVVPPTAPTEPAPRLDPHVNHLAAVRGFILGLANIRDVDFGPVADAMPIEQLLEAREERDEARRTFFAWSAALDATFECVKLTVQPASAAAPPSTSTAASDLAAVELHNNPAPMHDEVISLHIVGDIGAMHPSLSISTYRPAAILSGESTPAMYKAARRALMTPRRA
jgi:hypothetical protein